MPSGSGAASHRAVRRHRGVQPGRETVSRYWTNFKRFWLKEEVPRWIGMSLVAAYLCGLGSITYVAHRQTEALAVKTALAHGDHAMSLLAGLSAGVDEADAAQQEALLRRFSRRLDCERLCLVDAEGTVLASLDPQDVGKPNPMTWPAGASLEEVDRAAAGTVGWELDSEKADVLRRYYRLTVVPSGSAAPRTLEGILRWNTATAMSGGQAWLASVVLVAMGVLGVVYHLMRRHFRGVSCIADNLVTHAGRLEHELTSLRVADSLGAVASSWNTLIDLAETFRAEAGRSTAATELREVLERSGGGEWADAMDAIPDGLLVLSDEDLLVHCNASGARLMGWDPSASSRRRWGELEPSETGRAVGALLERSRAPDGDYEPHHELVECAGSSYRVRVVPQRKRRGHGSCVVVITDVSQQVRAERAREEFVSQVTHELRTPLTNIRAYTETLSSGMFDDPQVVSECYNVIGKETRRLSRLVEDMLSMSQLEVGSIQIVPDQVDPLSLIQEAVRDVRATAEEKKIDLQAILPAKVEPIEADRDKLAVVLNNLLGNALKYTPRGGEVRVGCQSTADHLLITVKDNGIGIDPAEQEHVFEKFHRSADPAVQGEPGTGIGLTTAREIARRHGGDIELMSERGKGSTFVVKLPRAKVVAGAGV